MPPTFLAPPRFTLVLFWLHLRTLRGSLGEHLASEDAGSDGRETLRSLTGERGPEWPHQVRKYAACLESENHRPAQWGLDEVGWLSVGGGGGWRGKATEADFSMSHLAICKPSVETRSSRLGLTCSHRNRSKVAGKYFIGVQPKNSWCVERPPRERLGYGFIISISTTDHQPKNILVITKQCIFAVCTCEAQFLQLIAEDMYLIYCIFDICAVLVLSWSRYSLVLNMSWSWFVQPRIQDYKSTRLQVQSNTVTHSNETIPAPSYKVIPPFCCLTVHR